MTRQATDEDVTLWFCPRCIASSTLVIDPDSDVPTIMLRIWETHRDKSGQCRASLTDLRVIQPDEWYARTIVCRSRNGGR